MARRSCRERRPDSRDILLEYRTCSVNCRGIDGSVVLFSWIYDGRSVLCGWVVIIVNCFREEVVHLSIDQSSLQVMQRTCRGRGTSVASHQPLHAALWRFLFWLCVVGFRAAGQCIHPHFPGALYLVPLVARGRIASCSPLRRVLRGPLSAYARALRLFTL